MELTGNTADRWEQVSNKIAEIASNIASKQELIKSISSTLDELTTDLDAERDALEKLGNLAYKEVLREESGTLNDETPAISEPEQATPTQEEKQAKSSTKKSAKKSTEAPKQSELPLLKDTETTDSKTESKQPHQQEG